jgi:transposase
VFAGGLVIAKVTDAEAIIADKGYDTEAIRDQVEQQGSKVVIPRSVILKGTQIWTKGHIAIGIW